MILSEVRVEYWKTLLVGLVLVMAVACTEPAQTGPLDHVAFRDAFVAKLREAAPGAAVSVVSEPEVIDGQTVAVESIRITASGEDERHIYLDQGYKRYRDGEPMDQVFASLISLATRPASPPYDPAQAYLLIRPTGFTEMFAAEPDEARRPVSLPLAGDLVILLAQDLGDAFTYPVRDEVLKRHDDAQAAWTAAMQRTTAAFGETRMQSNGDLHMLTARADIAASLLIDDAVWQSQQIKAISDAPAVAVFRDVIFVVDSRKPAAVRTLRELLAGERESPNLLSDQVFIRRNNRWAVLT